MGDGGILRDAGAACCACCLISFRLPSYSLDSNSGSSLKGSSNRFDFRFISCDGMYTVLSVSFMGDFSGLRAGLWVTLCPSADSGASDANAGFDTGSGLIVEAFCAVALGFTDFNPEGIDSEGLLYLVSIASDRKFRPVGASVFE